MWKFKSQFFNSKIIFILAMSVITQNTFAHDDSANCPGPQEINYENGKWVIHNSFDEQLFTVSGDQPSSPQIKSITFTSGFAQLNEATATREIDCEYQATPYDGTPVKVVAITNYQFACFVPDFTYWREDPNTLIANCSNENPFKCNFDTNAECA